MNWSETVDRAYQVAKAVDPDITRPQVTLVMRAMRAVFFDAAESHEEITWHGVFKVRYRHEAERMGWNPNNRERVVIPERTRVTIKPGANLRVAVGQDKTTRHYTKPEGWWRDEREAKKRMEAERED